MASSEFSDRTANIRLRQQLAEALERAWALAWAIARLEGRAEGAAAQAAARDAILDALAPEPMPANVVSFNRPEARDASTSAQEMLLAILKENEASVRELQLALDDCGHSVTPGNLSVMLSRMNQAGLIQRTGRGLYRYAR
jgi:hypothetical protein